MHRSAWYLTATARYTLYGLLLGSCFPTVGLLIGLAVDRLPLTFENLIRAYTHDPAEWVLNCIPVLLALAGALLGRGADTLRQQELLLRALAEREVAQRTQIEETLRERQTQLEVIVSSAPVVLFATDLAGVFTLSQGAGLAAIGCYSGASVGQSVFDLYREVPAICDSMRRALAGEYVAMTVDLGGVIFDANYTPLRNEEKQVLGVIGVAVDVTARTQAEHALQQVNETLERSVAERTLALSEANAQLQREVCERQRIEEALQRKAARLQALHTIDDAITGSLELPVTLQVVLAQASTQLQIDAATILLFDRQTQTLGYAAGIGFSSGALQHTRLRLGQSRAGRAAAEGRIISVPDLRADPGSMTNSPLLHAEGFVSYYAVPLTARHQLRGVIELFHRTPLTPDAAWLDFLEAVAAQAAIALDNASLFAELQRTKLDLEAQVQERTNELERALVATAEARDKLDAIVYALADGLLVTDLSQRIVLANPAAEALLGCRVCDMIGLTITEQPTQLALWRLLGEQVQPDAEQVDREIVLVNSDELRTRVIRVRTAPFDDRHGSPLGAVTILQDITQLRELDRLKTEFLSTAAHELRTPLTSIRGFSEILLTRQLTVERQQRYLGMINSQANQLGAIIDDLLDLSRLESGRGLAIAAEPLDLASLVHEVAQPFIETATEHRLQVECPPTGLSLRGDAFRLTQVVRNIISNALKYSPQGGQISIRGRMTAEQIEISIEDNGIGMTPEQQARLFEKFYRADASNTAIGGTGLGLAISKLIVELHGGRIWVESQRGVGTTVSFALPLAEE